MVRTMTQAKRVQDAVKRTGKGWQSVSIAESFREKDLRREIHIIWTPSCAVIRFIQQIRHSGKIEKFNGDVTVAKISHGE